MNEQDVRRYLQIKDFYQLLGVSKTSTDDEIKKAYRKLALKFHPDKCKVEGAQEVFKKIAQAYDCLSNKDKRAFYDRTGSDEPQQQYQRQYHQDDFDPNDIFNMFFQGFGPQQGHHYRRQQTHHQGQKGGGGLGLLQLAPLLILLFSSSIFSFFQEDPLYQFKRDYSYNVRRKTVVLDVDYFVKSSFGSKVENDRYVLQKTEFEIESIFINNLMQTCQNNQAYKRQLRQHAKYQRSQSNRDYYHRKAEQVDLSTCEKLDYLRQNHNLDRYY